MCKTHKWATVFMLLQFVIRVMLTYFILVYCRFAIVKPTLGFANSYAVIICELGRDLNNI